MAAYWNKVLLHIQSFIPMSFVEVISEDESINCCKYRFSILKAVIRFSKIIGIHVKPLIYKKLLMESINLNNCCIPAKYRNINANSAYKIIRIISVQLQIKSCFTLDLGFFLVEKIVHT